LSKWNLKNKIIYLFDTLEASADLFSWGILVIYSTTVLRFIHIDMDVSLCLKKLFVPTCWSLTHVSKFIVMEQLGNIKDSSFFHESSYIYEKKKKMIWEIQIARLPKTFGLIGIFSQLDRTHNCKKWSANWTLTQWLKMKTFKKMVKEMYLIFHWCKL
jgi:hypothetical protein